MFQKKCLTGFQTHIIQKALIDVQVKFSGAVSPQGAGLPNRNMERLWSSGIYYLITEIYL